MPFGFTTGAGVIFGVTGGVAEAVLRSANYILTVRNCLRSTLKKCRACKAYARQPLTSPDKRYESAWTHTLAQAKEIIRSVQEVKLTTTLSKSWPAQAVVSAAAVSPVPSHPSCGKSGPPASTRRIPLQLRKAQENPLVAALYDKWLGDVGSDEAHEALHTEYVQDGASSRKESVLTTVD